MDKVTGADFGGVPIEIHGRLAVPARRDVLVEARAAITNLLKQVPADGVGSR